MFMIIIIGYITITPDWYYYEYYYSIGGKQGMYIFNIISNMLKNHGYNYNAVHLVYTTITSGLLIYFITRFTNRVLFVVVIFLPSMFVFYTTQIRFYLAYFVIINALYQYYVMNRKILSIIMIIVALLTHYATMIIMPLFYIINHDIQQYNARAKIYTIIPIIVFLILTSYLTNNQVVNDYFVDSYQSSILGSTYSFLPYMLLFILSKKWLNNMLGEVRDFKLDFLYKVIYFPYLLFPIAFAYQIIGRRFIYSVILYHTLFILYKNQDKQDYSYHQELRYFILFIIFLNIYIYWLPLFLWGYSIRLDNFMMIIKSNTIIL